MCVCVSVCDPGVLLRVMLICMLGQEGVGSILFGLLVSNLLLYSKSCRFDWYVYMS